MSIGLDHLPVSINFQKKFLINEQIIPTLAILLLLFFWKYFFWVLLNSSGPPDMESNIASAMRLSCRHISTAASKLPVSTAWLMRPSTSETQSIFLKYWHRITNAQSGSILLYITINSIFPTPLAWPLRDMNLTERYIKPGLE